ncbi:MAG: hypothetical protein ABSH24_05340, partial [Bryobacteraceae bacterium]
MARFQLISLPVDRYQNADGLRSQVAFSSSFWDEIDQAIEQISSSPNRFSTVTSSTSPLCRGKRVEDLVVSQFEFLSAVRRAS